MKMGKTNSYAALNGSSHTSLLVPNSFFNIGIAKNEISVACPSTNKVDAPYISYFARRLLSVIE
jgi:hypothetical protein